MAIFYSYHLLEDIFWILACVCMCVCVCVYVVWGEGEVEDTGELA